MSIFTDIRCRIHKRRIKKAGVVLAGYHEMTGKKETGFVAVSPAGNEYLMIIKNVGYRPPEDI